jgi:hypothetical protein
MCLFFLNTHREDMVVRELPENDPHSRMYTDASIIGIPPTDILYQRRETDGIEYVSQHRLSDLITLVFFELTVWLTLRDLSVWS